MLLNVTYNILKANQIDFLEQLLSNIDNATCETFPIIMIGNYNLDFITTLERENLETVILLYGFSFVGPTLPTRSCEATKTRIDYIIMESIPDEKRFVFDSPFKTDYFRCALFTDLNIEKLSRIILCRFDKKIGQNCFLQNIVRSPMFQSLSVFNSDWYLWYTCLFVV